MWQTRKEVDNFPQKYDTELIKEAKSLDSIKHTGIYDNVNFSC